MDAPLIKVAVCCVMLFGFAKAKVLEKPDGISPEMYCLGCEATFKEIDLYLREKPARGMGETVTRTLSKVCDAGNFDKFEYNREKMLKVCKHIIKDEGLEALLITDYGRKHELGIQTSYLDISQKICGTHLHACPTTVTIGDAKGGGISIEDDNVIIRDGPRVRRVSPTREGGPKKEVEPKIEDFESLKEEDENQVREGGPADKKVEPEMEEMESLEREAAKFHEDSHDEL